MNIKEFITDNIKKKLGDYATAKKISETLGLSLVLVYGIVNNETVRSTKKYGRNLYSVDDFINQLKFADNYKIIDNVLSVEDNKVNNFYNWESRNEIEKYFENYLLDELGEFTSIPELTKLFKLSKSVWYSAIDEGKILSFSVTKRIVVLTRSLLPFIREGLGN